MHCHSYYSRDSLSSPESLVVEAKKRGLDGIALTDHDTTKGWQKAQKMADKLGMLLILGEEIKIKENGKTIGEILAYFINKEINPNGKTTKEIVDEIRNQGGLAIISHAYHWKKPFKKLEEYKNIVDGMEAFNARSQSKKGNKKTLDFATKNNLPTTAGSDSHTCFEIGNAYIETKAKTLEELKTAIKNKDVKVYGKQTSPAIQVFAGLSKLIHLFYKF